MLYKFVQTVFVKNGGITEQIHGSCLPKAFEGLCKILVKSTYKKNVKLSAYMHKQMLFLPSNQNHYQY